MCHRTDCLLSRPLASAALVVGVALAADAALPLTGHPTVSTHAGRHPWAALAAVGALALHFNSHRLGLSRLDPLAACGRRIRSIR